MVVCAFTRKERVNRMIQRLPKRETLSLKQERLKQAKDRKIQQSDTISSTEEAEEGNSFPSNTEKSGYKTNSSEDD